MSTIWKRGVAIFALVSCVGCSPALHQQPKDALRAYASALARKDYAAAYEMMEAAYRKQHDLAEFTRLLKGSPRAGERLASELRGAGQVTLHARFSYGKGQEVRLVEHSGAWRIAGDPTAFYGQATPRDALRSFVRAMRHRRYEIVLRFVPARWAGSMTTAKLQKLWEGEKRNEVEILLSELEANLTSPIQVEGDKATMAYGDRKTVRFVREDGIWKIEDPD